jgi:hypothetical protein
MFTKGAGNMSDNQRDPVEAAFAELDHKRRFHVGDLVRFEKRMFIVQSYIFEAERNGEYMLEEITYHLEPVWPRDQWDFGVACDDELEYVADAAQADDYLRFNDEGAGEMTYTGGAWDDAFSGKGDRHGVIPPKVEAAPRNAEKAERKRRSDYREWMDGKLDAVNRLRSRGEFAKADAVMREIEVRAVIHSAGGSVDGGVEAEEDGAKSTEGDGE